MRRPAQEIAPLHLSPRGARCPLQTETGSRRPPRHTKNRGAARACAVVTTRPTYLRNARATGVGRKHAHQGHSQEGEQQGPQDVHQVVQDVSAGALHDSQNEEPSAPAALCQGLGLGAGCGSRHRRGLPGQRQPQAEPPGQSPRAESPGRVPRESPPPAPMPRGRPASCRPQLSGPRRPAATGRPPARGEGEQCRLQAGRWPRPRVCLCDTNPRPALALTTPPRGRPRLGRTLCPLEARFCS